jgi:hypothetical protein
MPGDGEWPLSARAEGGFLKFAAPTDNGYRGSEHEKLKRGRNRHVPVGRFSVTDASRRNSRKIVATFRGSKNKESVKVVAVFSVAPLIWHVEV